VVQTCCGTGTCRCPVLTERDVWNGKRCYTGLDLCHIWGNLAASNGNEHGGEVRDVAAENMTPADLSTAQKLALECVRKKYRKCLVTGILEQQITCHFCFEQFEVDIEISQEFMGHNTEIYDCVVCCNPNKLSYEVCDGEIIYLTVSNGNEYFPYPHSKTLLSLSLSNLP